MLHAISITLQNLPHLVGSIFHNINKIALEKLNNKNNPDQAHTKDTSNVSVFIISICICICVPDI